MPPLSSIAAPLRRPPPLAILKGEREGGIERRRERIQCFVRSHL
jgi:hypothetical protein